MTPRGTLWLHAGTHKTILPEITRAIGQPSIFDGLDLRLNQGGVVA